MISFTRRRQPLSEDSPVGVLDLNFDVIVGLRRSGVGTIRQLRRADLSAWPESERFQILVALARFKPDTSPTPPRAA